MFEEKREFTWVHVSPRDFTSVHMLAYWKKGSRKSRCIARRTGCMKYVDGDMYESIIIYISDHPGRQ